MIVNKTGKFRGVKKPDFCRKSVFTARIIECLYVIGRSFIRRINLVKKFSNKPKMSKKRFVQQRIRSWRSRLVSRTTALYYSRSKEWDRITSVEQNGDIFFRRRYAVVPPVLGIRAGALCAWDEFIEHNSSGSGLVWMEDTAKSKPCPRMQYSGDNIFF